MAPPKRLPHLDASAEGSSEQALLASCWETLELSDLYGYPLWELPLFEALQPSFGNVCELFRCGCIISPSLDPKLSLSHAGKRTSQ